MIPRFFQQERQMAPDGSGKKIIVQKNGPYLVTGGIPLVRKVKVVSEHGEPLTWLKTEVIPTGKTYQLCRCGLSNEKPFCDSTHEIIGFDGKETASTRLTVERRMTLPGGKQIVVRRDLSLCIEAGFCADRFANIDRLLEEADEPRIRSLIIAMVERCPSGSYTYAFEEAGPDVEPDLPEQIAVTTEMTSDGPIMGSLWVTGNIPIERSDGKPIEMRNRVTLCRCGLSKNKPLCDGQHRAMNCKE
jgi:CDGSH-type Zn-finger protein